MLIHSCIFFFVGLLFWPILYTPFGQIGLAILFIVCLLPLVLQFLVFEHPRPVFLGTFLLSIFLFTFFVLGQIFFGSSSLFQSARFAILPFIFYSGYVLGSKILSSYSHIKSSILAIQLFFMANVVVIVLTFISPTLAGYFAYYYGQGDLFNSAYMSNVRYFGFSGQPAISAHTAVFLFLLMHFLISIAFSRDLLIRPAFIDKILYFSSILCFSILVLTTASRSSIIAFLISIFIPFFYSVISSVYLTRTIRRSWFVAVSLFSLFTVFYSGSLLNYIGSLYARYDSIFSMDTLAQRFGPYILAFNAHSDSILMSFFGFFLNTGISRSINPALYYTDSFMAFVYSHLGFVGIVFYVLYFQSLFKLCFSTVKLKKTPLSPFFDLSPITAALYLSIVSFLDPPLLDSRAVLIFGMIVSLIYFYKSENYTKLLPQNL